MAAISGYLSFFFFCSVAMASAEITAETTITVAATMAVATIIVVAEITAAASSLIAQAKKPRCTKVHRGFA